MRKFVIDKVFVIYLGQFLVLRLRPMMISPSIAELFLHLWRMDGFGEWRLTIVRPEPWLPQIPAKKEVTQKISPNVIKKNMVSPKFYTATQFWSTWHKLQSQTWLAPMLCICSWDSDESVRSIRRDKIWFPPPQTLARDAKKSYIVASSEWAHFDYFFRHPCFWLAIA